VVAATWYDGSYLRPVVGDDAFELEDHHGETEERFDHTYADTDGHTPVEGLYVAAPREGRNAQAIVSAGQGAHVARQLLADRRQAAGYPEGVLANHYDWLRPDSEFAGEWGDRDRWREWFARERPDDHDSGDADLETLRERAIDEAFATRLTDAEIDARRDAGQRRLLEHLDDDLVLERARELTDEAETERPGR